jgi:outer membrane protein insertion porin family
MLKFRVFVLALTLFAAGATHAGAQPPAAPQPPSPTFPAPATQPASGGQGRAQTPSPAPAGQSPTPLSSLPATAPKVDSQLPPVAKVATGTLSLCNGMYQIGPPSKLPPSGSPPVIYQVGPCFAKQGGLSVIDANTYLYYIQLRPSVPSQDRWIPYTDATEDQIVKDFKALWATNFLDDLSAETYDYVFANGVVGKVILYNMEERQRVKIVDYIGSKQVEQSKIDEELKKQNIQIRLDSFIDEGLVRRVSGVVRELYAEKGYEYAEVKPEIKPVSGGTKIVNLTFNITEGPKVKIRSIEFIGNKAISDRTLGRKMKENKAPGFLKFITGAGTYKEAKFEDDAEKVVGYYREQGYVKARVGQPELKILEDSKDGKNRHIELQIPVTEGDRYRVGEFTFAGNSVVKSEGLRPLFKLDKGDYYNEKKIRKGLDKARELYGSGGYFEFVGYPELSFPNEPAAPANGAANGKGNPNGNGDGDGAGPPGPALPAAAGKAPVKPGAKPVVDVTMRMEEGKQYFVHRITFVGNTTTRDNVIRREVRLFEGNVFNTEALKYSVRRLNQLGYFKNLEGDAIDVQKTPNAEAQVDVKLKLEEQNRNQITFGAGVSQYEGFFGQLAFQTSNFMGRGETFSVSLQQGNRAKNYQVGFTEPFLFDRPITAGVDFFNQEIQYLGAYTQASAGATTVWGFPAGPFSRFFVNYSYQKVRVKDLNPAYLTAATSFNNNPFLADSLLLNQGGERRISKIGPSYVYNSVDNPIFPTTGRRFSASFDLAGLGGNSNFVNPKAEAVWYLQQSRRTSLGFRAAIEYISPYGSTQELPIFEKLFLGGEYSIRGFDIRSVGPRDPSSQLVIGGNKSLLFNAEYLINIAGPVRLVLFADAGQVRDEGKAFAWKETLTRQITPGGLTPFPGDVFQVLPFLRTPLRSVAVPYDRVAAFKVSTGAEVRFFMPVLNVPFRLIFAMNPSRAGVLDNNFQPEKQFKFRFAVGTTF